jgi:hypothetical protein
VIITKYIKQQLAIVYMSSNNVGHIITRTIITLQHFFFIFLVSVATPRIRETANYKSAKSSCSATGLTAAVACIIIVNPPFNQESRTIESAGVQVVGVWACKLPV